MLSGGGGGADKWFLIKTVMLMEKVGCRNDSAESRRAGGLQGDLRERLPVVSDFYLLFVSVTLEAQRGCGLGVSRVCLTPTSERFDPSTRPRPGTAEAC